MVDPTGKRERVSLRRRLRLIQRHEILLRFASLEGGVPRFSEQHEYGVRYTVGGARIERRCAKMGNGSPNIQAPLLGKFTFVSKNYPQAHFNVLQCKLVEEQTIWY